MAVCWRVNVSAAAIRGATVVSILCRQPVKKAQAPPYRSLVRAGSHLLTGKIILLHPFPDIQYGYQTYRTVGYLYDVIVHALG